MSLGLCDSCKHHKVYFDEVDGALIDDGCVCWNNKASGDDHIHACYSYREDVECPHYKTIEDSDI